MTLRTHMILDNFFTYFNVHVFVRNTFKLWNTTSSPKPFAISNIIYKSIHIFFNSTFVQVMDSSVLTLFLTNVTAILPPSGVCGFEALSICGFNQDTEDDFDWSRVKGHTVSSGPVTDHTYKSSSKYRNREIHNIWVRHTYIL